VATTATQKTFLEASVTSLGPGTKTNSKTQTAQEEKPFTKPRQTTQNLTKTDQQQLSPETHKPGSSLEANPTKALHRSDRSRAPVRLITPGQLRMNCNRGSTPSKPTHDSLHRFAQDFGDSRNTSWALHIQDLVHQNLLNQEESKKSHQECL
jgi:hypothetical protein